MEKARLYNQYVGAQLTHWEILELPEDELNIALELIRAQFRLQSQEAKRQERQERGGARPKQLGRPPRRR